ncbi:ComF family protein [Gordonia sp. CPCC 205515]|uniref:ComF family protein n=1 Tax=Gordonia sp. CPCC 205515 TaxID=3140791 RepID=UPI003AF3FF38
MTEVFRSGSDLVVPIVCGGCERPGVSWCADCAAALADDPIATTPRVEVGVPVWALGHYRGPHRDALIAMKEHGRLDLTAPLGRALARGVATLARWGELPDAPTLVLVPAPTRASSARRRGGDPVTAMATTAVRVLGTHSHVAPLLVTSAWTRDSAGLDARRRAQNLSGAIRVRERGAHARERARRSCVILVDDVVTTGATAAQSVRVLAGIGVEVDAALVVAAA